MCETHKMKRYCIKQNKKRYRKRLQRLKNYV